MFISVPVSLTPSDVSDQFPVLSSSDDLRLAVPSAFSSSVSSSPKASLRSASLPISSALTAVHVPTYWLSATLAAVLCALCAAGVPPSSSFFLPHPQKTQETVINITQRITNTFFILSVSFRRRTLSGALPAVENQYFERSPCGCASDMIIRRNRRIATLLAKSIVFSDVLSLKEERL